MLKQLFIISLVLFSILSKSQQVSKSEAEFIGKKYFSERLSRIEKSEINDIKISTSELIKIENIPVYYVINFKKTGFIIVSADKNVIPVLAYSFKKNFEGDIPPSVNFWLNRYENQIKYIVENKIENQENQEKWKTLFSKETKEINDILIEPLVHTEWNQGIYYNSNCPADQAGPDGHCVTGCVATATAQLLYYHRFPKTGTGTHSYECPGYGTISENFSLSSYDYENMSYKLTNYSPSASLLLYNLGVSFDMNYGPNGSGVWNHSVDSSLQKYFKYCPETKYVFRDSTTLNWDSIVVTNLLADKPLYYAGWEDTTFQSGHAFVCDGYDGPDYYHFNWGWGGSYDGWFYSDNLTPGGSQFTFAQEIIKDIYPDTNLYTYPETCSGTTYIDYLLGSVSDDSGIQKYQKNSDCTWLINPSCGHIVNAYIDDFNLDENDTLFIYDGNESENYLLDYLVKDSEPKLSWMYGADEYTSSNGELMINFTSDDTLEGRGWKISYFSIPCKFGMSVTDSSGIISDGSEDCNYGKNINCSWEIKPTGAEAIKISFTEFNLDTNNTYDNVKIFKDALSSSNQIAKYTIDNLPTEITVPSGVAIVTFSTTSNSSGEGWSFYYETTTIDVDIINQQEFEIYPNPTKGIVNIESSKIIKNIKVYDISGKLLKDNNYSSENIHLDLSELKKGFYLIKIDNKINKIIID